MAKALTVAAISAQRPGGKRREIWDGATRGLFLVVQPSGAKSWAYRYRSPATRSKKKLTLGTWSDDTRNGVTTAETETITLPALTLAAARLAAGRAAQIVAHGRDPAIERKTKRRAAASVADTVDALLDEFLARHVNKGTGKRKGPLRTAHNVKLTIDKRIRPAWGARKIGAVTKADVLALVDDIADEGDDGKPIAANRTLALVHKFFAWCVARNRLAISPATGVEKPGKETRRERVLTDAELRAVWHATGAPGDPFDAMVRLLILTGQRRGEVAGMQWGELTLDGAIPFWALPSERTKNAKPHTVWLAPQVVGLLRSIKAVDDCSYVLTTNGKNPISGFSKYKRALDKRLGAAVAPWKLHDLRRTVASGMQRLGISIPVTERALNHVSGVFAGIVGTYQVDPMSDDVRIAFAAWAAHVGTLTK